MEDNNNNTAMFSFDSPKGQSSYIKVIGVGGGGGNAVNHMYREGIEGVDFIVCNTDMKALNASPVPNKIPLGTLGLGAGNKPEKARAAAEAKADDIREALSHNTQMLFITAGMGGGTGTGAAPVIAEIAKSIDLDSVENKKILVVAIVTRPFSFEGSRRRLQAEAGIEELRKHVDSIIVINNDKLRSFGNMRLSEAFGLADDVLLTAAKGIAEIITVNGYVGRDFQDINTVMEKSGTALMGTGRGSGENRAHDAIEAATESVLLDDSDISGAKNVLLYFTYSSEHEITMDEQGEITDYILDKTNGTADLIWGAGQDESLGDELKVILIATGFEKSAPESEGSVIKLVEEDTTSKPAARTKAADPDEITIIKHDAPAPAAKTITEPETIIVAQPVKVAPEPVATVQEPKKNVIWLEDEPSIDEVRRTAEAQVEQQKQEKATDEMVTDIHIVTPEPAPEPAAKPAVAVAKPAAEPAAEPAVAVVQPAAEPQAAQPNTVSSPYFGRAFSNDNDAMTAAERIRRIHELLRNTPEGADIVQKMRPSDNLYEGTHSSQREASGMSMGADGRITANPYLYGSQPD